ncbi:hypothetical protein L6452_35797 [Arctium lappa]|uniref:Uncharacterized protein n=1 Tax=Arctium lappa TaxID=4217 RepID=A0ACB8Y8B4_ARCLA|nr:hypothetical protein L6452_35797 [Arctium lappa]
MSHFPLDKTENIIYLRNLKYLSLLQLVPLRLTALLPIVIAIVARLSLQNDYGSTYAKLPEDSDFKTNPMIEIGNSSRCTRSTTRSKEDKVLEHSDCITNLVIEIGRSPRCTQSTTRSKEVKEKTPKKDTNGGKVVLSETKVEVKTEVNNLICLQLLYGEAAISEKVQVESKKPALSVWKLGHLRKRETTELEDGGFGLLPLKDGYKVKRTVLKGESGQLPHSPPSNMGKHVDNAEEFDACWECPNFVAAVDEKLAIEVHKSKLKKYLSKSMTEGCGFDAPGFHLGISPDKTQHGSNSVPNHTPTPIFALKPLSSQGTKDKGKREVIFSPL